MSVEAPVRYREVIRKARKPHQCRSCGVIIPKGQKYKDIDGLWDGSYDNIKLCKFCQELYVRLYEFCGWDEISLADIFEIAREYDLVEWHDYCQECWVPVDDCKNPEADPEHNSVDVYDLRNINLGEPNFFPEPFEESELLPKIGEYNEYFG